MTTSRRAVRSCRRFFPSIAIFIAVFAAACAGPSSTTTPPPVVVSVSPATASVETGQTKQFTASVTGTSNAAVTWQVSSTSAGAASIGTINSSGLYTAPANVPTGGTVTVTAISQADTTKAGAATVTVTAPAAISVAISPKSPTVQVGLTQQFVATVTNTTNTAVIWQVNGVTGGAAATGTISASGSYTAPATVPSGTITVAAISQADSSKSDSTTVTVTTTPVISIQLSPTAANVQAGIGKQNFAAVLTNDTANKGVTWSLSGAGCSGSACGTLTSVTTTSVTYNAPASVPNPALVTLTASSIADTTKISSAAITVATGVVSGLSVSITPARGGLTIGQSMNFTATVTNDVNAAGVTWTATSGSFSNQSLSAATYVAPATAGTVTVTATSKADGTKSVSAALGVTDLAGVATYHNNSSRDGTNTREFALTPANVATASFGKLFACPVDAEVYAQPLWVPNVTINGTGPKHNVIFVVTQHDSVYAFDADTSPCVTLWSKVGTSAGSLIPAGETWVTSGSSGSVDVPCGDLQPAIGIVGTPVIDLSTNTIYLVTRTKTVSPVSFHQRLHALDITSGAEKLPAVEISASLVSATFDPLKNNQRPGLALVNGNVYIAWSSQCDQGPYQGWVMAYSASTLTRVAIFTPAPNARTTIESGIWMSGGAPSVDSSNNLYLITGNGTFDANSTTAPNDDYGDSFLKLSTVSGIAVADYFTPNNEASMQSGDQDFGSGGAAILVDQPSGPVPHLVIGGGKGGILFLLNRDNMGKFSSTNVGAVQALNIGTDSIYATPAFWNNKLYIGGAFGGGGGHVQAFDFNPSTEKFASPSSSQSFTSYGFPGTTPSVSANSTSQGIVWAIDSSQNGTGTSTFGPAVLHAYDAASLANELWNSSQVSTDRAGVAVKFTVPTVANGKVYVGTQSEISVYGLKP